MRLPEETDPTKTTGAAFAALMYLEDEQHLCLSFWWHVLSNLHFQLSCGAGLLPPALSSSGLVSERPCPL